MRENIWPYWHRYSWTGEPPPPPYESWDADTLFDVVEVMHDFVSKPLDGNYHSYNGCGMHYTTFNRVEGQIEFRREMNRILRLNDPPYEMDLEGQIIEATAAEFRQLLSAPVPEGTPHDLVTSKIDGAVKRFQTRGASIEDRQHAVRDLADALEAIRGDVKGDYAHRRREGSVPRRQRVLDPAQQPGSARRLRPRHVVAVGLLRLPCDYPRRAQGSRRAVVGAGI
ncbi:MAG TPA: hypothetical protein VH042_08585 [Solirubrobacterales bacterium]|nr:hypothetical protein [Solirubrobacterales bacterium]